MPRQAGLVPDAEASLTLPIDWADAVGGLVGFSHVWLLTWFADARSERLRVRPPRLGGNATIGVFGSRSPFRPNPIGLSAVTLLAVEVGVDVVLRFGGADLVDGTPVLDIKPYVPYADSIAGADGSWAAEPPPRMPVSWSPAAQRVAETFGIRATAEQAIALDPRPAYRQGSVDRKTYGARFGDVDVRWRVEGDRAHIVEVLGPD